MSQLGLYTGIVRDVLVPFATDGKTPNTVFNRSNLPRFGLYDSASDAGSAPFLNNTGTMAAVPIYLVAGEVVTNISFVTGATAGATMTHWWMALYDSAATPNLLAQTADQTSGALALNTVITKPLATAQTVTKTGVYWVAIMIAATTQPSILGAVAAPLVVTGERNLAVSSGASLVATATATLATPAYQKFVPYVVLT